MPEITTDNTKVKRDSAKEPRKPSQLPLQPANNLQLPQAGRLSYCTDMWTKVTCNSLILNIVKDGLKIQFLTLPPMLHLKSFPFSPARIASISKGVSTLLEKSAIKTITPNDDQFVSPIFEVPKRDTDEGRVILNLKVLNNYIVKTKFRLESFDVIFSMIRPGDYMVSIDLKDAFHTFGMSPLFFKFLCFEWLGVRYCYTSMPFGLTSAPRVFTKVFKTVLVYLRSKGIRVSAFFDDVIIVASSINLIMEHLYFTRLTLRSLGFLINNNKSSLVPSKSMMHLGYIWNTDDYTISVPVDKVLNFKKLCSQALLALVSLRALQKILGTIESFRVAYPYAALRYRAIQRDVASHIRNGSSWDTKICPSDLSRRDLIWWQDCPDRLPPRPLTPFSPQITVTTDSSLSGWGAFTTSGLEAFGFWTEDEANLHINILETKAVLFSFKSFFRDLYDSSILIKSDNSTTVAYINHQGGVKNQTISDLIFELYEFCLARNILIKASFLQGRLNTRADTLSRHVKDTSLSLPSSLFSFLCDSFNLFPKIDLFASRLNFKLDQYYSEGPDPHAVGFDAFLMSWPPIVYSFPPINLVGKFLDKFQNDNISEALVITPFWPSKSYYPTLLELLANDPFIFPASMMETPQTLRHLSWFLASHISSRQDKVQAYQRTLSPVSCAALRPPPLSNTVHRGASLEIGVIHQKSVTATCL